MVFLYGIPMISSEFIHTEVNVEKINLGIEGIHNSTNYGIYPIAPLFVRIYKALGIPLGVEFGEIDLETLFESL